MKLEHRCVVPAPPDATWELLLDVPRAAACVPSIKEVTPEGENRYHTIIEVRVGPMRLNFSGTIVLLEQDREKGEARFHVEATDRKVGGGLRADMTMQMNPLSEGETVVLFVTVVAFMGKLGELGQPIIRRKAASTLEEFSRNISKHFQNQSG